MSIDTDLPRPAKHRWDVLAPFYIDITVEPADIDRLNHVNNAAYLGFMERAAWAHTEALGLDWATYQALDAACVVRRHEVDYLAAAHLGQTLRIATWIESNDGRLAMWRRFQIRRDQDGATIFRAATQYVTVTLSSGRPCRMPTRFAEAYRVHDG